MRRFSLFLVLAWVLILGGCSSHPNEKQIAQVDEAIKILSSADSLFQTIDIKKVMPYADTVNFDVKFVQQEFIDTMSLLVATQVDAYHRLVRSIGKFGAAYNAQKTDLEYSKNQLQNLKSDLTNNVIDSTGFELYFPAEEQSINRLVENNMNLVAWQKNIEDGFIRKRQPVDSLINAIKIKTGY
jgi:hypothetical protein